MVLVELLLVTLLALAFTALFSLVGVRSEAQWSWLGLFLVFLFGSWALAVWF